MERRTAQRIAFSSQVIAYVGDQQAVCGAHDLSATGMLLEAPTSPPAGNMRLIFQLAGSRTWVDVDASVVRQTVKQGRPAWGLRFNMVSPPLRALLESYVNLSLATGPPGTASQ